MMANGAATPSANGLTIGSLLGNLRTEAARLPVARGGTAF